MRFIFTFWKFTFKVPRIISLKVFLCGILENLIEKEIWKKSLKTTNPESEINKYLCPVLFSDLIGLLIVMPKTEVIQQPETISIPRKLKKVFPEVTKDNFRLYKGTQLLFNYKNITI